MASRAQALAEQFGTGPVKGGAEVLAFQDAMREAGLYDDAVCVLGAWLGGAPSEKFKGWRIQDYTFRDTASESCDTELDVPSALARLAKLDAELGSLVNAKASGAEFKQQANEQRNVDEDVAKLKKKASAALSFDVLGVTVTPQMLLVGAVLAVGAVVAVKVARAVGP